ncbi:MAG: hypothetical protein ABEH64_13895 [Salinirussus sp.]
MATDAGVEEIATIVDDGPQVAVCQVRTRNGTRLRLEAGAETIDLDAVALEALTWQDGPDRSALVEDDDGSERVRISNEYTAVDVVVPQNRAWLGLASRRLGYERRLDPTALTEIAHLGMSEISKLLRTPFGPEA